MAVQAARTWRSLRQPPPSPPSSRRRRRPLLGRRPRAPAHREGHDGGQPGDDPHLQAGVRARAVDREPGALRAVCHLSDLLLVGKARPQAARGRQAGAGGPLLGGPRAALREGPAAALVRHRLSQRLRSGLRPHRLLHLRARRLLVDRLLCHDQSRHGRDLRAERAGPARGPGPHRRARVPLPHDRSQPGGACGEPVACVLAEPQGGLRRLRAHPRAAARGHLRQEIHRRRERPGQRGRRAAGQRRADRLRHLRGRHCRHRPARRRGSRECLCSRSPQRSGWPTGREAAASPGATCAPTTQRRGACAWPRTPGACARAVSASSSAPQGCSAPARRGAPGRPELRRLDPGLLVGLAAVG